MYDGRTTLTNEVSEQLFEHFKDRVYTTTIPRNIRLAEAPSHGLPGVVYDSQSSGAQAYIALAKEIVQKRANELKSGLNATLTPDKEVI